MRNLEIKWTISRAYETAGYNICTLIDGSKKYRTKGGGYDMLGTVFAMWLAENHMPEIIEKLKPYSENSKNDSESFYGFFHRNERHYLDGGCGLDSVKAIARAIGLGVELVYSRNKKGLTNILIK